MNVLQQALLKYKEKFYFVYGFTDQDPCQKKMSGNQWPIFSGIFRSRVFTIVVQILLRIAQAKATQIYPRHGLVVARYYSQKSQYSASICNNFILLVSYVHFFEKWKESCSWLRLSRHFHNFYCTISCGESITNTTTIITPAVIWELSDEFCRRYFYG